MKIRILYLFILLFASCRYGIQTTYEFNGICLTRIDFDGASNFYYSKSKDKNNYNKNAYVRAEYYGFNNGMDLLLVFKKDSTIEIINYGVDKLYKNENSSLEIGDYSNDRLGTIVNNYQLKGFEIFRVSNVPKLERAFPENLNSKVVVGR